MFRTYVVMKNETIYFQCTFTTCFTRLKYSSNVLLYYNTTFKHVSNNLYKINFRLVCIMSEN
jgi:hypothetical protein